MLVPYVLWSSNMQSACVFCIVMNCTCRFSEQYDVARIILLSGNLANCLLTENIPLFLH
jgi:hypothetical protein